MLISRLTLAQMSALRMAAASPLKKLPGGVWATENARRRHNGDPLHYVSTGTIRALEARGLLRRSQTGRPAWDDDRLITAAGLAVLRQIAHIRKLRVLACYGNTCKGSELGCAKPKCDPGKRWRTWTHAHFVSVFGRCPRQCGERMKPDVDRRPNPNHS
jgi:hypothetical protein